MKPSTMVKDRSPGDKKKNDEIEEKDTKLPSAQTCYQRRNNSAIPVLKTSFLQVPGRSDLRAPLPDCSFPVFQPVGLFLLHQE